MELIAAIEELIIQLRCFQKYEENLKIFQVNDYLYARTVFYRVDKGPKDIRIPIMKMSELPISDLDILLDNKKFMDGVKTKLEAAITKEIDTTREKVNKQMKRDHHMVGKEQ